MKVSRLDSPTSEAFVGASYTIIAIGLVGAALGAVEIVVGYLAIGVIVAVLGVSAATLAVAKLRALKRWPFASRDGRPS